MGPHQVATVLLGWQMFVVHHRRVKIVDAPQYSLQWHWHSATLAGEAKVPTDMLAAQQESFRTALIASNVMETDGT
eukprot:12891812-Prorocentrum_lima.AAC.1